MLVAHLVVAVAHDDHQVAYAVVLEDLLQHLHRAHVGQVDVVEEQHERVLGCGQARQESRERLLEARALLEGPHPLGKRVRARQGRQLGHLGAQKRRVVAERLGQVGPPLLHLVVGPDQDLVAELPDGLEEREVRHVGVVLVELAADEQAVRAQRLRLHLAHKRGLPDARVAAHRGDHLAPGRRLVVVVRKLRHLALASVQLVGELEAPAEVPLAKGERFPCRAPLQVVQQPLAARVAVLRHLGQQLVDDGGQRRGQVRQEGKEAGRRLGDVREHHLGGNLRLERAAPRQHLEQRDAQRVEVRAMVEHGVHAPRLLGGEVAQRALDAVEPGAFCLLVREFRGDAQVEEHGAARLGIVDDVRGIHVLVDDACLVQVAQARHHLLGYEEELAHAERPLLQEPAQRGSRAVLLYQAVPAVQHDLADGLHHVRAVHQLHQAELPPQPLGCLGGHAVLPAGLQHHVPAGFAVGPAQDSARGGGVYLLEVLVPAAHRSHPGGEASSSSSAFTGMGLARKYPWA